jgi:hypothetical protein
MSKQETSQQAQNAPRHPRSKAGRTLLVKATNTQFDTKIFEDMVGLTSKHHTEKSNTHFLTFKTPQEALTGLKAIKATGNARVKFAHYRVFFKAEGLNDKSDYNTVKNEHSALVTKETGANVLYYRLYRKGNNFLGCGDFTIDTKDGFDKLLNAEGLKNFSVAGITGVHYRYKKTEEHSAGEADKE